MSFGQPSFIATVLLGDALAKRVTSLRSADQVYGSTTGPFGGIGGAAVSTFTITEFRIGNTLVYFADERFLGWAYTDSTPQEMFPRLNAGMTGLSNDPSKCPVTEVHELVVGKPDAVRREATRQDVHGSLSMAGLVHDISEDEVDWISTWLTEKGFARVWPAPRAPGPK